jgi:hypothetical protein
MRADVAVDNTETIPPTDYKLFNQRFGFLIGLTFLSWLKGESTY